MEKNAFKMNGFIMLFVDLLMLAAGLWLLIGQISILFGILSLLIFVLLLNGFRAVEPNESRVLIFFGSYTGIIRDSGFWWANPFAEKVKVLLRVHNFESSTLKVNDNAGNPIQIAAVVSWRVIDSAKAIFDVENYKEYISIQSETSIRSIASNYPYDSYNEDIPGISKPDKVIDESISLRQNSDIVSKELVEELSERLAIAGVEVLEARISNLAYAPEIAQAMLRRQQAEAIIMARKKIVDGAVGMVEMALNHISESGLVELDDDKKATMINNLLVTLTSEKETQPVINTGSIYS